MLQNLHFQSCYKKQIYELPLPIREGIITEIINIFNECEQTMRKAMLVMPEKICNYLEQEAFLFPFDSTKDELQFR